MTAIEPPADLGSSTGVDRARLALRNASKAMRGWHAGRNSDSRDTPPYTAFGGDALKDIDAALRALYDARAALVTEIRLDGEALNARVNALLAESRALPGANTTPVHDLRRSA